MPVKIKKIILNPFAENTFIVWDEDSKKTLIIDPGCSNSFEEREIEEFILNNNLVPRFLINTHCHVDHILGNAFVKEKFHVEFLAPEQDLFLLDLMMQQASVYGFEMKKSPEPDDYLNEDILIDFPSEIKFLYTPGHTPGEHCIYFPDEKFCITGDVLFKEGIGRVDLWGGDYNSLIHSIENKLFTLPDDTIIYPGHGEKSTIGYEKKYNPFLK